MDDSFSDILEDKEFGGDDLFAILERLEDFADFPPVDEAVVSTKEKEETSRFVSQKSTSSALQESEETELEASPKSKRQKLVPTTSLEDPNPDGQQRISHITVERNRRKQMNEHLSVLRSLMPNFYVKRGDQASIIGGVVDYINELQLILQSLEAKKQRKVYSEVLSPRLVSSPRPLALSPRKPPLSPRLSLPISPRTPQPGSPYKPRLQQGYLSPTISHSLEPSPTSSAASSSINDNINELVANSKSAMADVEVKFSGPHVLLKTVSPPIPGQALKIISALEDLSLEILHVSISTTDETMLNSFTIKIGIECQLSAEELALQIQQTFC
ncbi:transcription factor SPEECHLESS-like [Prosopis cineraria]|uniref:transcription factor SPEECHLESS-like n=1 Tax=Prosopis cineraria TaxID=364024 RepID=UPI00240FE89D|nr:transcription factor SPEECHLESS-like [Prosopis cineraria]XP_054788212.1 transcription factor SPEECHLESS-like [Prosopis cineraria]